MEQNHLDRALKKILQFSAHFNQYFQHKEPWKKGPGTNSCVYLSVNAVRSLAVAIYPFLPKSSQKIWTQLGIDGDVSAQRFDEISNIVIKQGHKLGKVFPLFEKVEESVIEEQKKKLETGIYIEKYFSSYINQGILQFGFWNNNKKPSISSVSKTNL